MALIALLVAVAGPEVRSAQADGPQTPFVVARGVSPHGVPWRTRIGEERGYGKRLPRYATIYFSIGRPDEQVDGIGHYLSVPLPLPHSFTFTANSGSEIDAFPESDTSGIANRRVARLVATMSEGPPLEFETQIPPVRLSDRFHWLRRLRFFDQFYPAGIEPVSIAAYDRNGRLIDRQPA